MKFAKEKQDKKEAKRNQKLTKEKLDILKQKQAKREKKIELLWEVESKKGELEYQKYQEALALYESK